MFFKRGKEEKWNFFLDREMNNIERVNRMCPAYWILEAFFLCFFVVNLLLTPQYALAEQGESQAQVFCSKFRSKIINPSS